MMGIFVPFSELSPASLIVQSSRCSPTGGKLASHCFREACLSCERLRVATQSDEAFGDFRETDGNAVVAADLDVWVVLLECLIEVPEDLETLPF